MIHREALAARILPESLKEVTQVVIKVVNFIKSSAVQTRLFRNLCADMDADHVNLLYYIEVRWLSRGNVLRRVFELKEELKEFLGTQKHAKCQQWLNLLEDPVWIARLCYLSDIFEKLNKLNLSLQGKDSNIMDFTDKLSAFQGCLDLWTRKLTSGRLTMFSRLAEFIEDSEAEISEELKQAILSHLKALKVEFEKYFPNLNASDFTLVRNPFVVNVGDCI